MSLAASHCSCGPTSKYISSSPSLHSCISSVPNTHLPPRSLTHRGPLTSTHPKPLFCFQEQASSLLLSSTPASYTHTQPGGKAMLLILLILPHNSPSPPPPRPSCSPAPPPGHHPSQKCLPPLGPQGSSEPAPGLTLKVNHEGLMLLLAGCQREGHPRTREPPQSSQVFLLTCLRDKMLLLPSCLALVPMLGRSHCHSHGREFHFLDGYFLVIPSSSFSLPGLNCE